MVKKTRNMLSCLYIICSTVLPIWVSPAMTQEMPSAADRVPSRTLIEILEQGTSAGIASVGRVRPISKIGLELIKEFEGWVATAYNDPAGYCTVGYGHLIALRRCETIDLKEFVSPLSMVRGEEILELDTRVARAAVQAMVTRELTDHQFDAVVSFVFNVGVGNFSRSSMLRFINQGETSAASSQFGRWVQAAGRVLPGLVARRACEKALFRGELELNSRGRVDRSECAALGAASAVPPSQIIDIERGE